MFCSVLKMLIIPEYVLFFIINDSKQEIPQLAVNLFFIVFTSYDSVENLTGYNIYIKKKSSSTKQTYSS